MKNKGWHKVEHLLEIKYNNPDFPEIPYYYFNDRRVIMRTEIDKNLPCSPKSVSRYMLDLHEDTVKALSDSPFDVFYLDVVLNYLIKRLRFNTSSEYAVKIYKKAMEINKSIDTYAWNYKGVPKIPINANNPDIESVLVDDIIIEPTNVEPKPTSVEPRSTKVEPKSTNVKPRSTNVKPRSTKVEPRSTNVKPRSTKVEPLIKYKSISQPEPKLITFDDDETTKIKSTLRKLKADADKAEEEAQISKLKKLELERKLISADNVKKVLAEQSVIHVSQYMNDKKLLPTKLENMDKRTIRKTLDVHYSKRIDDIQKYLTKDIKKNEVKFFDVISVVLKQLTKDNITPESIIRKLEEC